MSDGLESPSIPGGASQRQVPVVGVVAASGGARPLLELFDRLADGVDAAFVVFAAFAPGDENRSPGQIIQRARVRFVGALERVRLEPRRVYGVSTDRRPAFDADHLSTEDLGQSEELTPADRFLLALAKRRNADIAIILLGAGEVGAKCVAALKESGGVVLAQAAEDGEDEFGTGVAASCGVDFVAPLAEIVARLPELIGSRTAQIAGGGTADHRIRDAELKLRATRSELFAVLDGVSDAVVTIDGRDRIRDLNRSATAMFGRTQSEVAGRSVGVLFDEPLATPPGRFLETWAASGSREISARRQNGATFPVRLTGSAIDREGERLSLLFLQDTSGTRALEARLQTSHSDRLLSLAQVATALAHEINQPLAAATSYIATSRRLLAVSSAETPADAAHALDNAADQMLRAAKIVSRLREFVAGGAPRKTPQRLHELINNAFNIMLPSLRDAKVESYLRLRAENDLVIADGMQIERSITTLTRIARGAMLESARRELTISSWIANDVIHVEVAGAGMGISPTGEDRLLAAYPSTSDEGLGVGLLVSRVIFEAHDGRLWTEPNPDGGGRFRFCLPLADAAAGGSDAGGA